MNLHVIFYSNSLLIRLKDIFTKVDVNNKNRPLMQLKETKFYHFKKFLFYSINKSRKQYQFY